VIYSYRETIHILPVGEVDTLLLDHIQRVVSESFFSRTSLFPMLPVPLFTKDREGDRYNALEILNFLSSEDTGRVLAIANLDLYIPGYKFIFGLAENPGQRSIIGVQRLNGRPWNIHVTRADFFESCAKEAMHELGHTYGLGHCSNERCVMAFSKSLADTLYKSKKFCAGCLSSIVKHLNHNASRRA
jgi:archaemetzincin